MTTASTIGSLLQARAEQDADRNYLRCGDTVRTYGEMAVLADRIAAGMATLGLARGSMLAILSGSRSEFPELCLAAARSGIVAVPLNAFLKGEFLRYQLENSGATAIAVDQPGYESLVPLLPTLPELTTIICFDAVPDDRPGGNRRVVAFAELASSDAAFAAPALDADDLASLLYTSGTTGLPKGCIISHGYAMRFARDWCRVLELEAADSVYELYPMFHASAQIAGIISPMVVGCEASLELQFSAQAFAQRLIDLQPTTVAGIGAHALLFLAVAPSDIERQHRVRAMFFAPCPPQTRAAVTERFGSEVTAALYGQTECCPLTFSPLRERASTNPFTCGRANPGLEVAILDDDDVAVPTGQPGEIVAKAIDRHALFGGYWKNPEATEGAFRGGWYHTGDAGILEADGTLTFVDRKKNVIRRRGENISSIELESAIATFPKVADVAVFAIRSEMLEDEVMATITLHEGESTTPEELFAFFKENLPYFAIPRYVDLSGEIPRNALNRVMKNILQDRGVTDTTLDFTELGLVVGRQERRGAS